jgi:hypothetical protein
MNLISKIIDLINNTEEFRQMYADGGLFAAAINSIITISDYDEEADTDEDNIIYAMINSIYVAVEFLAMYDNDVIKYGSKELEEIINFDRANLVSISGFINTGEEPESIEEYREKLVKIEALKKKLYNQKQNATLE